MALSTKEKHALKKTIKQLEQYRGRHTELVSVYVPQGYDINKISQHLAQEQGTATNIKSTGTRKNVIDALEKMLQHLKLIPKTPPNGLALFSGNVSEQEGKSDVQVWAIEPPVPLNTRIYRCDKQFQLDLLKDMLDDKEMYGLIVLDRREGDTALLKGKALIPLTNTTSNVPGKTRAGGQSAARYGRLREDAAKDFYKEIAAIATSDFYEKEGLKGIILGGPGPTKYEFFDGNFMNQELKKKVIGIKDLSYTGQFGLQELLEKCDDLLAAEEVMQEKKVMGRFFDMLSKTPNKVTYGLDDVKKKLEMGAVEIVLVSEAMDDETIEALEEMGTTVNSEVMIISVDTREGAQLRDMGKIVAILRYEMH